MAAWIAFFWACVPTDPVSTHLLPCWVAFTSQMAAKKAVNDAQKCYDIAVKLWGETEQQENN